MDSRISTRMEEEAMKTRTKIKAGQPPDPC
jgi:hypothetical protein